MGTGGGVEQRLLWGLFGRSAPVTACASGPLHVARVDSREVQEQDRAGVRGGAGPDGEGAETPVDRVLPNRRPVPLP